MGEAEQLMSDEFLISPSRPWGSGALREELGNDKCPAWLGPVAFSQSVRISTGCHQCGYFSHAIDSPEKVIKTVEIARPAHTLCDHRAPRGTQAL